jgi:nitrogen fixation/metabolism regulation signal transduction histidine kinase
VKLKTRLWIYLTVLHLLGFSAVVYYREHLGWWFLVLEALLAVSFVVGARLIKNALEPLDFVRAFSDVVDSGEYNARYSTIGQLDMDGLIETFNVMLSQLQAERLRLGEQRGFLERFLSVTPIGILILDFDGRVRVANPAAAAFLEAAGDQLMEQRLAELENPLGKRLAGLENNPAIMITDAEGRRLRCLRSEFFDRGFGRSLQSNLRYANELAQDEGAQFRESLEVVITRNSHLNEFTRGFANLVRLPEPERRPEKVRDLVDAVQAIFLPEFERRAIELEVDVSPELPQVSLDRNQMEQVLINVVKNAVESIDREGRIAISASRERGEVVLRVIDDGAGLSDESRENLFSPFYTSKEQGQGLGLTLVKEILTQHRFRYSLQSQGPLTEFRIQMPTG